MSSERLVTVTDNNHAAGGFLEVNGYTLKNNPGVSFSITADPKASATSSCQPPFSVATAGAGVTYDAGASAVEIVLSGGIGPYYDKRYLIGQKVTATVLAPYHVTVSSHDWSVTDGEPFKDWTAKLLPKNG